MSDYVFWELKQCVFLDRFLVCTQVQTKKVNPVSPNDTVFMHLQVNCVVVHYSLSNSDQIE